LSYLPVAEAVSELSKLGVRLFQPAQKVDWSDLSGCESIVKEIKTNVIESAIHADVFDEIMKMTRVRPETNRPRAVLFEGRPGTGKTSAAKIIASQGSLPLVFVPLQSIMSMYYGQSEKTLSNIFAAVDKLGDAIIFIDEIDSLAPSRDSDIHEASRRILSVLLQRLDGLESSDNNSLVIAASNRKQDLDSALLSRFDVVIRFPDPNASQRAEIFAQYAKQLSSDQLKSLAERSVSMTGRDIRDVCSHAERSWGSELVQRFGGRVHSKLGSSLVKASAPPFDQYMKSLEKRLVGLQVY
jgi:SpoVK/Ycf46/Vps4 family AAA+-type ATPase